MGVGQVDAFIGNKTTTYPKEVVSAAGYLKNINQTRWYLWDTNIPSLQTTEKVILKINDGSNVKTYELSFFAYDSGSGRKGFMAKGDVFNFSNLTGTNVKFTLSW